MNIHCGEGLLVTSGSKVHGLISELLPDEFGSVFFTAEHPSEDTGKFVIVTKSLTVRSLVLDTKMSPARFFASQGIQTEKLTKLQKICDTTRTFK